jgi:hypothetical protein
VTAESLTTRPPAHHIRLNARRSRSARLAALATVTLACLAALAHTPTAQAAAPPPPAQDPFYSYTGATPLSQIAPGTVLKTRTLSFHLLGIPLPRIALVQLLYRSNTVYGTPTTNVTSVLLPPTPSATPHLVAYGSFYDSLDRDDEPSYTFAGAPLSEGRELPSVEAAVIAPLLLAGDTVDVADTEGQAADFAAGPEYGMLTLDGVRAALASPATHLTAVTPVALMGYSGGAIATAWAAQLAPSYAPDVESRLVGATMGGVLVEPAHNLLYVSGSRTWAGVSPMALIGITRAYHASITRYLSAYGRQVIAGMQQDSINQANDDYPNLTFPQLVLPQYANPDSIPVFVRLANQLILGHTALPQVPLLIAQGAGGEFDGTSGDLPGIGPGDGVMITGDVRTYAGEACAAGDPVQYSQYNLLPHEETALPWELASLPWLAARFTGQTAPSDCADIAPGNPLTPVTYQPPGG